MKVRCSDEAGNSAIGNVTINTEDLGVPSISVSNSGVWSTSKTVTIEYNDTININEYRIESGSATKEDGTALTVGTWYQTSNKEEKVIFTSNGNISVRKSDGTNTLTPVSQNVSMIDTTVPTLIMTSKKTTSGTIVDSDTWSNEVLTFTLIKGDVGASGSTLYYCKDTNNTCTPNTKVESGVSFNITDTGIYYIRYKALSGSGKESSIGTYKAKVDTTVPTVTIVAKKTTTAEAIASDTWSNEVLTYTLTKGTTGASGSTLYYCKDTNNTCTPSTKVESSFNITDTGIYYIRYKAINGLGKESSVGTYKAKIDKEKPTVEVSDINTSYETKDEITLILKDNLSEVTHYCVTSESTSDNCNWISGNGTVKHTINTNGTYYAYSKDAVGNISEAKEFVIDKIDTESPSATLTVTSKTTKSITVKAVCTDNVGITKYEYSKDNGNSYETGENNTYTFSNLTTGTYNLKVRCSDAAGNSAIGNATDTTTELTIPTYAVSNSGNWSISKTVTITYPEGYTNEYQIINGTATKEDGTTLTSGTWYKASSTQEKVIFTSNGNITARTSDGTNTVTATSQLVSDIETVKPIDMTLSANSDTTYAKTKSVTVTLKDTGGSGLAAGSIKYGWSTSTSTEPSSYTTVSTSATSGTNTTTFTASGSGLTGSYYLWVVPVTYKDNAGNSNTTTVKSTGTFKFDNTAPSLTLGTVTSTKDSITVPYTASDSHSEIDTTSCVYGTSTSYGSNGTISGSNCVMSGLNSSTTYYYKVTTTDKAGNSTYKTGSSKTASACTNLDDNGNCITTTTYTTGDAITLGGYNWHVIGDTGTNVTLLMDAGQLGDNSNMKHCTDDTDASTDCGVDSTGTYYVYSWDKSLIRTYLNSTFLTDLQSKISNEIVSTSICADPSRGDGGTTYGGYLMSELSALGKTSSCTTQVSDKVRLITYSEYYNMSPKYTSTSSSYPNVENITKISSDSNYASWLYCQSSSCGTSSGYWWTMGSYSRSTAVGVRNARLVISAGALSSGNGIGSSGVRPVVTIVK